MLTDPQLLDLAGGAAFARGRKYRDEDRIALERHDGDGLQGAAHGSEVYPLWLKRAGVGWRWNCACPAADGGSFCKHLVAAVLVARDGRAQPGAGLAGDDATDDQRPLAAKRGKRRSKAKPGADTDAKARRGAAGADKPDDLRDYLRAQPAARLAQWLRQFADADREIDRRLRLYRAADDPSLLKAALASVLTPGGTLDGRGSQRYALRLDAAIDQLRALAARDPATCRTLCEYTLGRLFGVYGRSDDSSGAIGDRVHEVAAVHARACADAPPGKPLARTLFALQRKDDWGMLPLAAYWEALGAEGQRAYGALVLTDLARLPPHPRSDEERYGEALGVLHHAEAYARCAGDFALLQRVLRWDMKYPHDHVRVIGSLHEFGREREALALAEAAVKKFPRDAALRLALAECLDRAALGDEAVGHAWEAFQLQPGESAWDALKRLAGPAWPSWRKRALALVDGRAPNNASQVTRLLLHDGDVDGATTTARTRPVSTGTLETLAERLAFAHPGLAGEFHLRVVQHEVQAATASAYPRLVAHLQRGARLAPDAARPVIIALRRDHARKTRLMALLDQAGL